MHAFRNRCHFAHYLKAGEATFDQPTNIMTRQFFLQMFNADEERNADVVAVSGSLIFLCDEQSRSVEMKIEQFENAIIAHYNVYHFKRQKHLLEPQTRRYKYNKL